MSSVQKPDCILEVFTSWQVAFCSFFVCEIAKGFCKGSICKHNVKSYLLLIFDAVHNNVI